MTGHPNAKILAQMAEDAKTDANFLDNWEFILGNGGDIEWRTLHDDNAPMQSWSDFTGALHMIGRDDMQYWECSSRIDNAGRHNA